MRLEVVADAAALARRGADEVEVAAAAALRERGRFCLALSGGNTPWATVRELARRPLRWEQIHLFQVDERVAPPDHDDRNLRGLLACLGDLPAQVHAMPVERPDLAAAAAQYARTLAKLCGYPPVLDLVHLGLGADGHTASLVTGDAALDVGDADVAVTGPYRGRCRLTLTFPALSRARARLWLVAGADKRAALARLLEGDRGIPAGRVLRRHSLVAADAAAAAGLNLPDEGI